MTYTDDMLGLLVGNGACSKCQMYKVSIYRKYHEH